MNHQKKILAIMLALGLSHAGSASAVIAYDQNVTNNAIFGTGNGNGSYTVDTDNNVELGLRGKLRHNASGFPEDTFNSNSDGTYNFSARRISSELSPKVDKVMPPTSYSLSLFFCFSGFRYTTFIYSHFLMLPLQRSGCFSFASQ
jgi:hypothetical protein